MADELFPTDMGEEIIDVDELDEDEAVGYQPGLAFDYDTGDFIRDGRHRILDATGVEAWKQWCVNCIQTERYKHVAYNTDFGIELDAVFAATSRAEAESILTREINDAIMADPYGRTAYVDSLEYNWQGADAVEITATVVGIDDVTIDITAYIQQEDYS